MKTEWKVIPAMIALAGGALLVFFWLRPANGQPDGQPDGRPDGESYGKLRMDMVKQQIAARGVKDQAVLRAMEKIPRHHYVSEKYRSRAYSDHALPIEAQQTISQPYIVAAMTEAMRVDTNSVVLEVGTGSGYQAAVLGEIVKQVYTIEIVDELAESAAKRLKKEGFTNVEVKAGDGYKGWPEHAPFDAIIVTAAPDHVPQPLIDQLKPGARLVIPVGKQWDVQELLVLTRQADGSTIKRELMPVRFVPMTGKAQEKPNKK